MKSFSFDKTHMIRHNAFILFIEEGMNHETCETNGSYRYTQTTLYRLCQLMHQQQIDAWIISSADPHQSEYVTGHWQARAWLSGFTGSAGTLIVTQQMAGLWTDKRYHIRAQQELAGSGIELFKMGVPGVPTYPEWLAQELPQEAVVGFDGSLFL